MQVPVRIVHLEDDPLDAELVAVALENGGIACALRRVESREQYVAALQHGEIDVILSDYSLPAFNGGSALEMARALQPEVPFILVSGVFGEEAAVESMVSGATDYVLKGRLSRLAPAVRRALAEVENRRERRRLEDELRQSQKLEAVGQLAGGVAHDFNNMLTVIISCAEVALSNVAPDDPTHGDLEQIRESANRAAILTRQLLAFSRRQLLQPVLVSLNTVVGNLQGLLARLIGENVTLSVRLADDLRCVRADPAQLEQVLMNLAINARDAMPRGGTLEIRTAAADLDEGFRRRHPDAKPGRYAILTVSDTGCGMEEAVLRRIFEPFFTTKGPGKGTGLGLATVYGIVRQSGGAIEVQSQVGQGSQFRVYFPSEEGPPHTLEPPRKLPPVTGRETVLVVDDEVGVRRALHRILESAGYRVLDARSGEEAIGVAQAGTGPLDLLVLDVIMSGIDGTTTARRILEARPELPVLFMSGYVDEALQTRGVPGAGAGFIQKPFTVSEVLRKVRQALDRAHPE